MEMRGGGTRGRPELGAPHRRRDWDGRGEQAAGRGPHAARGAAVAGLAEPGGRGPGDRVLLVVAVHLEYHRLRLDVLHEAPGDGRGDVLNVIEVERRSFAAVLQRLSGEGLVVTVDKTRIHSSALASNIQESMNSYLN